MTISTPASDNSAKNAVLPVSWHGNLPEPAVRMAADLRNVLARPGCPCAGPAYYMYRAVSRSTDDRAWMETAGIRYDITVIPPRTLCGEFIKTIGHYHPENASGTGYPEVYEVLSGKAHYLIQTRDCSDIVLVACNSGDIAVIPPGYGHVTINPSKNAVLEMANIVSSRFSSMYEGYEERHGAAYYEMDTGEYLRNLSYPDPPPVRFFHAGEILSMPGFAKSPLYEMIRDKAEILDALNHPEKYLDGFRKLYR